MKNMTFVLPVKCLSIFIALQMFFSGGIAAAAGNKNFIPILHLLLADKKVVTVVPPPATFRLPDTGQTGDYTATFGEDSDYTIHPPSYTDNNNGTVTDNNTGLMWQQAYIGQDYNWYQAAGIYDATDNPTTQNVCQEQMTGSYSDWRLPTKKELVSIVDYGRNNSSINPIFTYSTSYCWSSTIYAYNVDYAWCVNFVNGNVSYNGKSDGNDIRCVRGGK